MTQSVKKLKPNEKPLETEPLSKENWLGYWIHEIMEDATFLIGHQDGNDRIVHGLEKILNTAKSYAELKKELLEFVQDRKDFSNDLDKKWFSDNPEKWRLPRLGTDHS